MEQQNPDCFSSYLRRQFVLHGLFSYQTHRPTSAALGRLATHHGDDALFLAVVEQGLSSRTWFVIERRFQAPFFVAMADLADCLNCQGNALGYAWRAHASSQLRKHCRPQHNSDWL